MSIEELKAKYEVSKIDSDGWFDAWARAHDANRATPECVEDERDAASALIAEMEKLLKLIVNCENCGGTGQHHLPSPEGFSCQFKPCPTCTPIRSAYRSENMGGKR